MEATSTGSIKAARWYMGALVAISLYRAMTQSVTPGEAWNYDRFIGPAWNEALSRFDVNNHVLNTLLVRISTARFHLTELSLRLPSLVAGVLYLWVAFRLARRWFGEGPVFLAVLGLLTLNPVVVDSLSEARGYGVAMAAWMWALELMLESMQEFSARKLKLAGAIPPLRSGFGLAGVCLGLSVAASLAFLAPACALLGVYLVWLRGLPEARGHRWEMPQIFLVTVFVLLVIPLNHAQWKTLGVGATSLRQTINELTALSLGTSLKILGGVARVLVALVALAGTAWSVSQWRREGTGLAALAGATLGSTLVLLLAAHRWLRTPFPQEGAIYLIPLIVLTVASVILKKHNNTAQITFLCLSALLLARYIWIFPFGMYAAGAPFADGRTLAKVLRQKAGNREVRIGASVAVEPIVNYYRWRYRQGNWQPVESLVMTTRQPFTGTYDYYVLTPADAGLIEERHLHVLYRDRGLALAQ